MLRMLRAKPLVQGIVIVVSGPVRSRKVRIVSSYLNAVKGSGYEKEGRILTVRHPDDDPNPEYIDQHKAFVTSSPDEIADLVNDKIRTVIIAGGSHYKDSGIVNLVDGLVRSNRDTLLTGLNLDSNGEPHNHMAELMALADEVILQKAICAYPFCREDGANRSAKGNGFFYPVCSYHYDHPDSMERLSAGKLRMRIGPMFSNKSEELSDEIKDLDSKSVPYVIFKWSEDARYTEKLREKFTKGYLTLHEGGRIPAVCVSTAEDIRDYLENHPKIKNSFIGEGQFFPRLFGVAKELVSRGYNLRIDALARDAQRKPFNDVPKLMCLANDIDVCYAICVDSFEPATESFRIDQSNKDQIKVGGLGDYLAKSLNYWSSEGEEPLKYNFKRFEW